MDDVRRRFALLRPAAWPLAIGAVAIFGGMFAKSQNIAFLVALAFAVAASANLPTILYSLFWKRFNTRGALWSIYGGLLSSIILIFFRNSDFNLFSTRTCYGRRNTSSKINTCASRSFK